MLLMRRNLEFHSSSNKTLSLQLSNFLFKFYPLFFLLFFSSTSYGFPIRSHIFIYAGCSNEKYKPNSQFESNFNSLLSSMVSSSSQTTFNSFAIGNQSSVLADDQEEGAIFGLYQCRGDLAIADCSKCIQNGVNQLHLACTYSLGASLQLEGCYVRYEHFDFLGKLDTSVKFKKCSTQSSSNDIEFFRRRDDVLADMQAGNNVGFRVSSSGLVQGFAQCLGDLNSQDCSSCIGDAVGKLKSLCGSAAAADVFLGQCYARYWASGFYPNSSGKQNPNPTNITLISSSSFFFFFFFLAF